MARQLDYQSRVNSRGALAVGPVARAVAIMAGVVVVANGGLLALATADRSWGALAIGILWGPIANLVLAIISLACASEVKQGAEGAAIWPYVLASIGVPASAAFLDLVVIGSMGLHGC